VPLGFASKRQTCVSHSTPEAELVAADFGVRGVGLPSLSLWELLLAKPPKFTWYEDNSAAVQIMKSGRNPTIRHLGRTSRVSHTFLTEVANGPFCNLVQCHTDLMCADVFTKPFLIDCKWTHARMLIGCFVPGEVWSRGVSCFTPPPSTKAMVTVPAPIVDRNWKYTVIEFCCDEDSTIGRYCPSDKGCRVIRITKSDDALSKDWDEKVSGCLSHRSYAYPVRRNPVHRRFAVAKD